MQKECEMQLLASLGAKINPFGKTRNEMQLKTWSTHVKKLVPDDFHRYNLQPCGQQWIPSPIE